MKNQIREKTGTELPKFTVGSTSLFGKKSNQHSRQSSQGSINSVVSDLSVREESESKSSHSIAVTVRLRWWRGVARRILDSESFVFRLD